MATDNTDTSVIYFPGDVGHNPGGATASIPANKVSAGTTAAIVVPTFTATSSAVPTGIKVKFVNDDLWYYNTSWVGPYTTST